MASASVVGETTIFEFDDIMFLAEKSSSVLSSTPSPKQTAKAQSSNHGGSSSPSSALHSAHVSYTTTRSRIPPTTTLPTSTLPTSTLPNTNVPSLNSNATSNGTIAQNGSQESFKSVGGLAGLVGVISATSSIAIFAAMIAFYMYRRRRRQRTTVSPAQDEKKPHASWRQSSRVAPWKPLSMGVNNHDDENDAWSWDHQSRQSSRGNLQEFPEIVVMDARPAAPTPYTQPMSYSPPTPYTPLTPAADDFDYSAMTDDDPEFDASPLSLGYRPTYTPTTIIPPPSQIPTPNRSPSTSTSSRPSSNSSLNRFSPTSAPKRVPSSSKQSHIPLAKRNVRGSITTMIPPVTNPPPRRDSLDISNYGLPRGSMISRGSLSPPSSPSVTPTPSSPLRRPSIGQGATVPAQTRGPRKERGVREGNRILEEADVGDSGSSYFGKKAPTRRP